MDIQKIVKNELLSILESDDVRNSNKVVSLHLLRNIVDIELDNFLLSERLKDLSSIINQNEYHKTPLWDEGSSIPPSLSNVYFTSIKNISKIELVFDKNNFEKRKTIVLTYNHDKKSLSFKSDNRKYVKYILTLASNEIKDTFIALYKLSEYYNTDIIYNQIGIYRKNALHGNITEHIEYLINNMTIGNDDYSSIIVPDNIKNLSANIGGRWTFEKYIYENHDIITKKVPLEVESLPNFYQRQIKKYTK